MRKRSLLSYNSLRRRPLLPLVLLTIVLLVIFYAAVHVGNTPLTTNSRSGDVSAVLLDVPALQHSTTTRVSCTPSTVVVGQAASCTANVSDTSTTGATTPTGTVAFTSNGAGAFTGSPCTLTGTGVLASCATSATYAPSAMGIGIHTITGTYSGDLTHSALPVGTTTVTVTLRTTSTTISCSPATVPIGQPSTCTATVADTSPPTASTPTGTVTFTSTGGAGTFSATTCTLSAGTCSVTFTPGSTTSTSISASYGGDTIHSTSNTATAATVTGVPRTTSTTISCTPATLPIGQASTCSITVADNNGAGATTPTGTISFTSTGGAGSFSATTCSLSVGTCSVTFTPNTTTATSISASYGGDSVHAASNTATAATVTGALRTTSATLSCTPATLPIAQASTCTATVADTNGAGATTPTGIVTFASTDGAGTFSSLTCSLTAGTCPVTFTPGSTTASRITATYGGDSTHATSTSAASTVTGQLRTTSTTVSCAPATVPIGQASTCTATVVDTNGVGATTPTGTVTFASAGGAGTFSAPTCSLTTGSCSVTFTPGSTTASSIAGAYGGDSTDATSTSVAVAVTGSDFTMILSTSQLYVAAGGSVKTNITVTSVGLSNEAVILTASAPVGAMGFTPPPQFSPPLVILSLGTSGTATLTIFTSDTTSYGLYVMMATGTSRSIQHTIRFNVTVTDFSVVVSPNLISISPGLKGNSTIAVTGLSGFNGTITLAAISTGSGFILSLSNVTLTLTPAKQGGNSTIFITVPSNTPPHVYTVRVTGSSGPVLSHNVILTISVVEFGIVVQPVVRFQVGSSQSTPLIVVSQNGFEGIVTLTVSAVDPTNGGLTATINPNTVTILPNVSGSATLLLSGNIPGQYYLTINGTSKGEYSVQHLWVYVGDFSISSSTPSVIMVPGTSRSFTLGLAGENSFTGTITLSSTSNSVDLQVALNHSSVTLAPGQPLIITVTLTAAHGAKPGIYTIILYGNSGQLSHDLAISVTVAYPPSLDVPSIETVNQGSLITFYINVTDSDPSVTLSTSLLPSGASFITTYRTGTTTVVTGIFNWKPSTSQSGDYVITFTAQDRNGGVTTRQVTVHVNPVNRSISLPPLSMILYGLIAAAGVIGTFVGGLVWRQRKLKASSTSIQPR